MLTDETKAQIQAAYRDWLQQSGCRPRTGQRKMIAEIARSLGAIDCDAEGKRRSENGIVMIEAGTGTGKTLAYLLPLIVMAANMGKKVVVATATVTLQEQLIDKDLPELIERANLQFSYGLAKGRGRYLCLQHIDRELVSGLQEDLIPLFEDTTPVAPSGELYSKLMSNFQDGKWDGERDHWPEAIADGTWFRITSESATCTGPQCPFFQPCPFFKARKNLEDCDLIVANHDLLLADLGLGGGVILPRLEDALIVIDEGHKLPDRAINHFSMRVRIQQTKTWVEQIVSLLDGLAQRAGGAQKCKTWAAEAAHSGQNLVAGLGELFALIEDLVPPDVPRQGDPRCRFDHGTLPGELVEQAKKLQHDGGALHSTLQAVCNYVQDEAILGVAADLDADTAEECRPWLNMFENRLAGVLELLQDYAAAPVAATPLDDVDAEQRVETQSAAQIQARWVRLIVQREQRGERSDIQDAELASSSVVAGALGDDFWTRACAVIVTSATLRALNSFERFRFRAVVPEYATEHYFPSPFDYQQVGTLVVPHGCVNGNEVESHTDSLVSLMPLLFTKGAGTLALFSSWRQLRTVRERMPEGVADMILGQDDYGKQEVLRLHRERIDAGRASVLFGVASFAEGIDLPGAYCRHVIIAKLPFMVPDDPIEAALSEWIEDQGGNAFKELSLPVASLRLIQASGRLLRNEHDHGQVTILDRRILSKYYGQQLLDSLPPFRRVLNRPLSP